MYKKIVSCLAMMLCCLFLAVPAFAAEPNDGVMPANLYTAKIAVGGSIDMVTGELSCTTQVITYEECSFYVTMDVYQLVGTGWEEIESFRRPVFGSHTGMAKNFTITCDVEKGYSYKVVATAYVTSVEDGISETVTETSPVFQYK